MKKTGLAVLLFLGLSLIAITACFATSKIQHELKIDPERIRKIMDEVISEEPGEVSQKYQNSWKGKRIEKKLSANNKKLGECRQEAAREAGFELGFKILYKKCLEEHRKVKAKWLKKKEKFLFELREKYK